MIETHPAPAGERAPRHQEKCSPSWSPGLRTGSPRVGPAGKAFQRERVAPGTAGHSTRTESLRPVRSCGEHTSPPVAESLLPESRHEVSPGAMDLINQTRQKLDRTGQSHAWGWGRGAGVAFSPVPGSRKPRADQRRRAGPALALGGTEVWAGGCRPSPQMPASRKG